MHKHSNVFNVSGMPGRMLALRLGPGADLVSGIISACKENGIKAGGIMSMLGSLTEAKFFAVAADPSSKTGAGFSEKKVVQGPVEFLSGQGIICDKDGEMFIHLHGVMSDVHSNVFGGHIEQGDCTVANTFEAIILEGQDFIFSREVDKVSGVTVSFPKKSKGRS